MADSNNVPSSPASGGRGRGRRNSDSTPNSPYRGRGRGRGRGGRGRGRGDNNNNIEASYGRPPGGSFGARLTETAPQNQIPNMDDRRRPQSEVPADMPPIERKESIGTEESEVCFICASPIEHIAIAPCNHQTCHICSLRLRALYKTRACAHCRVSQGHQDPVNLVLTNSRLNHHSWCSQIHQTSDFKNSRTASL